MSLPILSVRIRHEDDTVAARQRARQISRLLGFDAQDQTRIATAVSEIARNAYRYAGGGKVDFTVEGVTSPQILIVTISDQGPGIADLERILEGRYTSTTGMGLGILGARRLMDQFNVQSAPGLGSIIQLKKVFSRKAPLITTHTLAKLSEELAKEKPQGAVGELQLQNQELLRTLEELRKRQEELTLLNRELEDTNRGVVALYAELDEKADHLRRADELKSKFLSNMSHEFRSPLNSILALTRLLSDGMDGPLNVEQLQQVGFVRKAAQDLYELVNDLLDLAKVEAGKVEVKPIYFEVDKLFGALRGMLRPLFLNQSVVLVFDDAQALAPMFSDEGKISQILRNFISNALKFTERGEVRVTAEVVGDNVRFSVSDTGIGISSEDQERVFQDFAQVDHPIQRRVKGTGLGLPLSRKLAHLLGGVISVESALGQGSVFTLQVPSIVSAQEEISIPAASAEDDDRFPVLVVEDRKDLVLTYAKWLRNTRFRMVHANTTRDAEKRIQLEKPIAIILDITLGGEDSWNLLADLKNAPGTQDIPVIVVTTVDDPRKGFHLGADEYLVKPVSQQQFLQALEQLTAQVGKILIIDDNESDRYILKHRLRSTRLEITEAGNGPDGIAKAVREQPQLIFLDLVMPGMTGFEVLEALKADPRTSAIRVVINTSLRLGDKDRERLTGVAAAVISKEQLKREQGLESILAQLGDSAGIVLESKMTSSKMESSNT